MLLETQNIVEMSLSKLDPLSLSRENLDDVISIPIVHSLGSDWSETHAS